LQDFRQNGDDAIIDFEVKMKPEKIASIMQEGIFKKFKLTSTISTSNMHLFDAEGKIKKFETPEQSKAFAMHSFEAQHYVMFFILNFALFLMQFLKSFIHYGWSIMRGER
jgi:DNA topoisomerase-2